MQVDSILFDSIRFDLVFDKILFHFISCHCTRFESIGLDLIGPWFDLIIFSVIRVQAIDPGYRNLNLSHIISSPQQSSPWSQANQDDTKWNNTAPEEKITIKNITRTASKYLINSIYIYQSCAVLSVLTLFYTRTYWVFHLVLYRGSKAETVSAPRAQLTAPAVNVGPPAVFPFVRSCQGERS